MKAYQIMLFMFLFNMFFWVVTAGLGFYDVSASTDPGFNLTNAPKNPDLGILTVFTLFGNRFITALGVTSIALLAGGIAVGAMTGVFTAGQGAQGIVYSLFAYFFWSAMSNTLQVFYLMSTEPAIVYLLAIFTMIIGVVFVSGLFQMVTGGWRAHE